jgi:hypothetical protein
MPEKPRLITGWAEHALRKLHGTFIMMIFDIRDGRASGQGKNSDNG